MKIYKGDIGVILNVQAFLDLLEEDAVDEVIQMILDIEEQSALMGFDEAEIFHVDMGEIPEDFDADKMFEHFFNNLESYEVYSENGYGALLGDIFHTEEEVIDNLMLSNEDLRVKRIVQRFRHIDSAS